MKNPPPSTQISDAVNLELFAAVVESAKDSIVVTNTVLDKPGPTIVYVNPAFTEMTGYSADEVIGKSPRLLHGPETERQVLDDVREKLSNNGIFSGKTVNYRKDGSRFIIEWHIEPVVIREHPGRYFMAIQHDVTERERLYQKVTESERQLRQHASDIEAKNHALHELLQQIEVEKQTIREEVTANIEAALLPALRRLKRKVNATESEYITMLENNLRDLNASFGRKLTGKSFGLSPREVEIAHMIRQGLGTKAIALALNISARTVDTHRSKIRQKFDIQQADVNLCAYLQSL